MKLSIAGTKDVLTACQVLFGPGVDVSHDFLAIIEPGGVKSAFRSRARETHPDLHPADPEVQERQSLLFHELSVAYAKVERYCSRRASLYDKGQMPPVSPQASPGRTTRTGPDHAQSGNRHGLFHAGEVPVRRMLTGRFLYYRGIIPYHAILESLTWQRRQRPSVGQIARTWGWLNEASVGQILTTTCASLRFCERAQEMGLLTAYQGKVLLNSQRMRQRQLGEYFVAQGYLSQRQLARLLAEMNRHNTGIIPR